MTDTTVAREGFRVGACFSRSLSVFFGNFISFSLLGLAVVVPGILLIIAVFGAAFVELMTYDPALGGPPPDFSGMHFGLLGVAWLLMLSLQYLLTAVIVFGALRYLQGNKASFLACLMQGLRRIVPIIIIAVITTLLVGIGMILLIVPGIIIALMICLAIPVLMVENPGTLASLSRSRELTKGSRWRLFGLLLLAFIVTSIIGFVVPLPFDLLLPLEGPLSFLGTVVGIAVQVFITVFFAVLLGVAYHDLRVAKEGVSTEQLAAVFD